MKHLVALAVIALVGFSLVESATVARAGLAQSSAVVFKREDGWLYFVARAIGLQTLAETEIGKLSKAEPKHEAHEVAILKADVAKSKQLVAALAAEADQTKLKSLESELNSANNKLYAELQKPASTKSAVFN